MFYLAIDQHSKQLTVNLRDEGGDVVLRRQVSTRWDSVRKFFEKLTGDCASDGGFAAILEVCGFNDWLVKLLRDPRYGCRKVLLIQPEKRKKRKTDRRDANELGEILWVNRERLLAGKRVQKVRQVLPPTEEEAADRQLTALKKRTTDRRTRIIGRVWRIVHKHNLQHDRPTKGVQTKRARQWLAELALPPIDRLEMDQLLAEWSLVEAHLEELDRRIDAHQARSEKAILVSSMPGLSKYGSLAVSSRVSQIDRFSRGASLANFLGLAPGCRNSGNTTDRIGSITKQGSTMVRFLLGQAVLHVLREDAWMRRWYREVKGRRGSKVARVAVMRRLATILWSMLKHNIPYIPGGPEEFRRARERIETLRAEGRSLAEA
jgi:transposase